eukprot:9476553-Pyramimonas_sp.AAC.1
MWGGSMCSQLGPIGCREGAYYSQLGSITDRMPPQRNTYLCYVERVYAHRTDQSDEGRGYMPTGRTNQMSGEGLFGSFRRLTCTSGSSMARAASSLATAWRASPPGWRDAAPPGGSAVSTSA